MRVMRYVLAVALGTWATSVFEQPTPTSPLPNLKNYEQPLTDQAFLQDPLKSFRYLSTLFQAFVDIEDEVNAMTALRMMQQRARSVSTTNPEFLSFTRKTQEIFDIFLIRLRRVSENRKFLCTLVTKDLQELLSPDQTAGATWCVDVKETVAERVFVNDVNTRLFKGDITGALRKFQESGSTSRLYRTEMVLITMLLHKDQKAPCIRLWIDDWELTPFQKFIVLNAYWNALFLRFPVGVKENQAMSDRQFRLVLTLPHARAIMDRLLLALGNSEVQSRLSRIPILRPVIERCSLGRLPYSPKPTSDQGMVGFAPSPIQDDIIDTRLRQAASVLNARRSNQAYSAPSSFPELNV